MLRDPVATGNHHRIGTLEAGTHDRRASHLTYRRLPRYQGHGRYGSSSEINNLHVKTILAKYPGVFGDPGRKTAAAECIAANGQFGELGRSDGAKRKLHEQADC